MFIVYFCRVGVRRDQLGDQSEYYVVDITGGSGSVRQDT